ncbi:hypothetical protein EMCRGX_G028563 [Ephydatia muelleri]|eukprot:Em0020g86a
MDQPPNKLLTLLFVMRPNQVLLGMKKRGFAIGRWNGFGGKVQVGETIEDAAKRETLEECGLVVSSLDKVGVMLFEFLNDPQILEVHVYRTEQFEGVLQESEEMRPQWFNVMEIPFQSMWPDDSMWFPFLLSKRYFNGYFKYEGHNTILNHTITETEGPHKS